MVKYSWSRWGLRSTNGITATEGGPLETGVVSRAERDVIHLVPIHVTAARTTTIATNSGRRHHGRSPAAAIRTLDSDTASGAPIPADETPDTGTAPTYSGRRPGRDARPYTGCDARSVGSRPHLRARGRMQLSRPALEIPVELTEVVVDVARGLVAIANV